MVIDEKLQMYILYKEFSSRFCALDFRGMVCEQLDINAKETPGLLLKVDSHRNEYIAFLQEHNYLELIANMLMYCELTDNLKSLALRLKDLQMRYPDSNIAIIASMLSVPFDEVKEDIFGLRFGKERHRCFGKLKRDMLK